MPHPSAAGEPGGRVPRGPAPWATPLLFLAALALCSINLDLPPHFDELYHMLAARGWLATGTPAIAEGQYPRGLWFTVLVAWLTDLLGDRLWVARLPSVVAVALSTVLLFRWIHAMAGRAAAWTVALLFLTSPFTLELARFARFYAIQQLLFLAGAVALEAAVAGRRRAAGRLLAGAVGLALLALAVLVQPAGLIGVAGLGLWLLLARIVPWLAGLPPPRRRALVLLGAGLAAAAVTLLLVTPQGDYLLSLYRWAPPWAAAMRDQVWFYHLWLVLYYPSLWPLVPLLALLAWRLCPRPALLATCVFGTAVVLQSFGGLKDTRYLAYAWPFLFVLLGLALAGLWPSLRGFVVRRLARLPLPLARRLVVRTGLALLAGFALLANAGLVRSVAMLADVRVPPQPPWPGWERIGAALGPALDAPGALLVTNELAALRYLGGYDLLVSRSRIMEIGGEPFTRDHRTGRPVIADAASLARVMDCLPEGLVLSEEARWRASPHLGEELADLLVRRARPLDLPADLGFRAWRWTTPEASVATPACEALRDRLRPR